MNDIFTGKLVRLSAADPEEISRAAPSWNRNSEYARLIDSSARPMMSPKAVLKWLEKQAEEMSPATYSFSIRILADDRLIGDIGLEVVNWNGRDAFVGLGIGEPEYWSRGYGTDVMNILLRFAFMEANLHRVSLTVFEYNPRAIRSYEKAGFRHEGRLRRIINREGRRWDILFMGILRDDWLKSNPSTKATGE